MYFVILIEYTYHFLSANILLFFYITNLFLKKNTKCRIL